MSTIRIKRKVRSTLLKIRELEKYVGKKVELEINVKELESEKNMLISKSLAGILSDFADKKLVNKEKSAWVLAVREKHENY